MKAGDEIEIGDELKVRWTGVDFEISQDLERGRRSAIFLDIPTAAELVAVLSKELEGDC